MLKASGDAGEAGENKMYTEDKGSATKGNGELQGSDVCKSKEEIRDGIEVKPKKVPIGGIQMPGFFTRSKSKEKCKDGEEPVEGPDGTELLENKARNENDDSMLSQSRIKLPNPFRKSKTGDDDVEKAEDFVRDKNFVNSLRKKVAGVLPNKKKDANLETQTKAGLASMETLDDHKDEMKSIPLEEKKVTEMPTEDASWKHFLKTYRKPISGLMVFLLLLIIILSIVLPTKNNLTNSPVKDGRFIEAVTYCGPVEGMVDDSAVAFRGIPYARPPVGDLRFVAAQPIDSLDYCWNGTFIAHNSTDTCVQIDSNGLTTGTEDCLTLDVVTPYVRYHNPLPVIVLIGSETFMGGSPGKMRPSARYARTRDVLFVRPNFRLGVLGFLALEELSQSTYPPSSGNYALSDIVLALKWVQLNIRHFGGDPRSVTLFGHRAGATLVTALATMPNANKLFDRVWSTSGGALFPVKSLSEAEVENKSYLKATGCDSLECLRSKGPQALMEAVEDTWRRPQPDLPAKMENASARHQWLVIDGIILKEYPSTVWADENRNLSVKLILGTTAHASSTEKLYLKYTNWTDELVSAHIRNSVLSTLNLTNEVLDLYPHTYKGLTQMISDVRTVCPLYAIWTQMRGVSFYVVSQTRSTERMPVALADIDSDVDAILGRYEPKTPEQRRYFSALQQLFYHYVWHGTVVEPNESSDGTVGHPHRNVLVIEQDILLARNYSHCDYWISKDVVLTHAQLD